MAAAYPRRPDALDQCGRVVVGPVDRVLADAAHQVLPDVEVEDTVHVIARQQGIAGPVMR